MAPEVRINHDLVSKVRKVKVELVRDIDLESVPVMFGSERKERNRVIAVTSDFDLDLKGQKGHTKLKRIRTLDIDLENAHM